MEAVIFPLLIVLFVLAIAWLIRRDRASARNWGNPNGQSSISTGQQTENPHFVATEPVEGSTVNGSPVDELSHQAKTERKTLNLRDTSDVCAQKVQSISLDGKVA